MIDSDKIYAYFEDNHGPLERSTNGWYEGECPFCRKRKLYVNPEYFTVKCYRGCYRGSVISFVKEYFNCLYFEAATILRDIVPGMRLDKYMDIVSKPKKDMVLPDGYNKILDGQNPMARRARNYLKDRGFNLNYLDMIGVGYADDGDYFGYIIIPFKPPLIFCSII